MDNVTMTDFGEKMEGINDEFIIVETLGLSFFPFFILFM